jgi:long-subunit acyl-CoA synthetase (AMP-forming)
VAGRSKNLLITSFGRNISPEWVESEVLAGNEFYQAVVIGDGRPCCAALLHPRDPGMSNRHIQDAVNRANQRLPDYARIGPWLCLDSPLSQADGLLTENGRPRRDAIAARHAVAIDQLYTETKEFLAS